jgi:hypothetical protein
MVINLAKNDSEVSPNIANFGVKLRYNVKGTSFIFTQIIIMESKKVCMIMNKMKLKNILRMLESYYLLMFLQIEIIKCSFINSNINARFHF